MTDPELGERAVRLPRADFELSESAIEHFREQVVDAPLQVVVGKADANIDGDLADRRLSTRSTLSIEHLDGAHLLSAEAPDELGRVVAAALPTPDRS